MLYPISRELTTARYNIRKYAVVDLPVCKVKLFYKPVQNTAIFKAVKLNIFI